MTRFLSPSFAFCLLFFCFLFHLTDTRASFHFETFDSYANHYITSDELKKRYGLTWGMMLKDVHQKLSDQGFHEQRFDLNTYEKASTEQEASCLFRLWFSFDYFQKKVYDEWKRYDFEGDNPIKTKHVVFQNPKKSGGLVIIVGSAFSKTQGLLRLYTYPSCDRVDILQPQDTQYIYHEKDYFIGDIASIRDGAHSPPHDSTIHGILSNTTASWLSSFRLHIDNRESDPLWIDESSNTLYKFIEYRPYSDYNTEYTPHFATTTPYFPDYDLGKSDPYSDEKEAAFHPFYEVFAYAFSTYELTRVYSYDVFGAETIFIPKKKPVPAPPIKSEPKVKIQKPKVKVQPDTSDTSSENVIWAVITGFIILYFCFAKSFWKNWEKYTQEKKRKIFEKEKKVKEVKAAEKRRKKKERRSGFIQDMEKVEWLMSEHAFDPAKDLLDRLKTQYPELSGEIEERRRRVMEAQSQYFKEKGEENLP